MCDNRLETCALFTVVQSELYLAFINFKRLSDISLKCQQVNHAERITHTVAHRTCRAFCGLIAPRKNKSIAMQSTTNLDLLISNSSSIHSHKLTYIDRLISTTVYRCSIIHAKHWLITFTITQNQLFCCFPALSEQARLRLRQRTVRCITHLMPNLQ